MLETYISQHKLSPDFKVKALRYWHPLAKDIASKYSRLQQTPMFVGINGCQGSGKSTLCDYLKQYLQTKYQFNVVSMSLDDFYLTSDERKTNASNIHPLFTTRGVPGTHDVKRLENTLNLLAKLTQGQELILPQFDKLTDEPLANEVCPKVIGTVDIVLFEGWCWGIPAQHDIDLNAPINGLERRYDPSLVWRRTVNQTLKQHYMPLYKKMDFWLMLQAPSFACVYQWRVEQEQRMLYRQAVSSGKAMSDKDIANFVQYFQRLTEYALVELPSNMDRVFKLNANREVVSVEKRSNDEDM